MATEVAQKAGLIKAGDVVVLTAGLPVGVPGTTNMIKVHLVGSSLISGAGVGNENVKGVLCVCRTLEDVKQKFRPGMILVVPHTNNEMLPYVRDAIGVITEENGMGSHAAVVGLSLNKAAHCGGHWRHPHPAGWDEGLHVTAWGRGCGAEPGRVRVDMRKMHTVGRGFHGVFFCSMRGETAGFFSNVTHPLTFPPASI